MPFDGTTTLPQVAIDLITARAYLVEHGWCQGTGRDASGRVCALGAIGHSLRDLNGNVEYDRAINAESFLARLENFSGPGDVAYWNDAPGRTMAEVIDRFDRAIATAICDDVG